MGNFDEFAVGDGFALRFVADNTQICPECNKSFTPYNNRKDIIFCNYKCCLQNVQKKKKDIRKQILDSTIFICLWCKNQFDPQRGNQKFCNDKCREMFKEFRKRVEAPKVNSQCEICSLKFTSVHKNAKFCSPNCRQIGKAKLIKERHIKNPNKRSEYQKEHRKRNNLAVRKHRLKNWYGISIERYDEILDSQSKKCAICKKDLDLGKSTCLDHKHSEERGESAVRGILCSPCNKGLGNFFDNIDYLKSAIKYIEKYESGDNS